MPANREPIYPKVPKIGWGTISTANTAKDGSGAVVTIFEAGTEGARVDTIKIKGLGTNVATVLRGFLNNGGANSTPTNNSLLFEKTIPATTLSEVAETQEIEIKFDGEDKAQLVLPPNYKLNVTLGTAVAAGLAVTAVGGDY